MDCNIKSTQFNLHPQENQSKCKHGK